MEHRVTQASLFDGKDAANNGSVFSDPAFSGNKRLPIHRWVPWIAGYSQQFVQDALKRYLPTQGTVLDPFAGVGTTLVEAILSGHHALGFEINPYAALACRTKLNACTLDPQTVRAMLTSSGRSTNWRPRTPTHRTVPLPQVLKPEAHSTAPKCCTKCSVCRTS